MAISGNAVKNFNIRNHLAYTPLMFAKGAQLRLLVLALVSEVEQGAI